MAEQPPKPRKRWTLLRPDEPAVQALQQQLGIHPLLCRLLINRGISDYASAKRFFRPGWSHLHDPFSMRDMEKAVHRLQKAIRRREGILLYGDYDVDGTTSVALMWEFLRLRTPHLDFYLPDRYREGYGLSAKGLEAAQNRGCSLMLVLDCGIRAVDLARRAPQMGIDLIICDHHEAGEALPEAEAVLDPKRADATYPYRELSACALAFKLCQAYVDKEGEAVDGELTSLLDLVVTSLACDIVPLTGENRVLAHLGLEAMQKTCRPGLRALWSVSERTAPYTISDIVFGIGPRINAAGRMADADLAVRLMIETDEGRAQAWARELDQRNRIRREYDQRISREALEQAAEQSAETFPCTAVLYQRHWHKGLLGIAASRVSERLHRPTIVFTRADGKITGSARSVGGLDIYKALARCDDLLHNWGGHTHAAGLTLRPGCLEAFRDRFESVVREMQGTEPREPELAVEAFLDLDDIGPGLMNKLRQFAPFGPGNRNPVFAVARVKDSGFSRILKEEHLRLCMTSKAGRSYEAIGFGMADAYSWIARNKPADIAFTLSQDRWREEVRIRLMLKDIRPSAL